MEEHCPQPGLPVREDLVIVVEALSQVSQVTVLSGRRTQPPRRCNKSKQQQQSAVVCIKHVHGFALTE